MDLLEYQAKKLFRQVEIPVLPSETIINPRDLKQLQIPYPVVLKSQVPVGGRGQAGGIKFVANTIDAIAAARMIFNLSILGEYPEVILAESRYNAQKELFLAIILDYKLQCPVIFGSISGGMDIESLIDNLQQVIVKQEFAPFLARRLAVKMGLAGDLLLAVSDIIEKMYRLFETKDLDRIEINPLGVDANGNLMALDGKITISDHALARHPELINLNALGINSSKSSLLPHQINQVSTNSINLVSKQSLSNSSFGGTKQNKNQISEVEQEVLWLDWSDKKGKIALITSDRELALLSWSLIRQEKEKPARAVVIKDVSTPNLLQQVIEQLQSIKEIKVILINFWGTETAYSAIANTIFAICQPFSSPVTSVGEERAILPANGAKGRLRRSPADKSPLKTPDLSSLKFVIRFPEKNLEFYQKEFSHNSIYWTNQLEDSIDQAISFSKTK